MISSIQKDSKHEVESEYIFCSSFSDRNQESPKYILPTGVLFSFTDFLVSWQIKPIGTISFQFFPVSEARLSELC